MALSEYTAAADGFSVMPGCVFFLSPDSMPAGSDAAKALRHYTWNLGGALKLMTSERVWRVEVGSAQSAAEVRDCLKRFGLQALVKAELQSAARAEVECEG